MQIREIKNREMIFFLSTIRTLGSAGIRQIYERCPKLSMILTMDLEEMGARFSLKEEKLKSIQVAIGYWEEILQEYYRLQAKGVEFLTWEDEDFPNRLKEIPQAPMYLYCKGRRDLDIQKSVAIVGSRRASNYGKEIANYIATNLAKHDVGIISGMALGIDTFAHKGALSVNGTTMAVLGCGVDISYPVENYPIYEDIIASQNGCILSEYPLGTKPLSFHFPMRNRIISGLADLVIVVEAREKSGSLITVDHALEQGKTVYAVPGRVTDVMSKGCNALIEMGASVFTSVESILENLSLCQKTKSTTLDSKKNINILANNEKMVYSCVELEPKYIDEIVDEVRLSYGEVYTVLLELELQGFVTQISRNYYGKRL